MKKKKQTESFRISNLKRKAEQGDADAQFNLGVLYYYGDGVPQDYAKARRWWEQAAAQGHAGATLNLGLMYVRGQGVPQNDAKARQWWERAAAHGDANTQKILKILFAHTRKARTLAA